MLQFEFITEDDLRESLKGDWAEIEACNKVKAWKAVHVLAGSVVETLLIDYLGTHAVPAIPMGDLLEKGLAQLIKVSRARNILTERTSQLSTVVCGYRNLIHPGRIVRFNEEVSEESASIAIALVKIVVQEIEIRKKENYGYTAQQIVTKVESDSTSTAILPHLIAGMKPIEVERLLLSVIPEHYCALVQSDHESSDLSALQRLATCFRNAFDGADDDVKKKVTEKLVTVVKEHNSFYVGVYETVFFRSPDLRYLSAADQSLIKTHLLDLLKTDASQANLDVCSGLSRFLTGDELHEMLRALLAAVGRVSTESWQGAVDLIQTEFRTMSSDAQKQSKAVLRIWGEHWKKHKHLFALERFKDLQELLDAQTFTEDDIPF